GQVLSNPVSFETSVRSGPRHCGQSAGARRELNVKLRIARPRAAQMQRHLVFIVGIDLVGMNTGVRRRAPAFILPTSPAPYVPTEDVEWSGGAVWGKPPVSSAPSKIPYGGFSPVRLQTHLTPRPPSQASRCPLIGRHCQCCLSRR